MLVTVAIAMRRYLILSKGCSCVCCCYIHDTNTFVRCYVVLSCCYVSILYNIHLVIVLQTYKILTLNTQ